MAYMYTDIQNALDAARNANGGKAFVTETDIERNDNVRASLCMLLRAYNVFDATVYNAATSKDLATLYASARKGMDTGGLVANRIATKYAHNPLFDEPVETHGDINRGIAPGTPRPAPAPTGAPTAVDVSRITDTVMARVNPALRELRTEVEETTQAYADTLLKFSEALPSVVADQVAHCLANATPTHLIVTMPDAEAPRDLGLVHFRTDVIIKALAAGVNVYLHGPAGSGKTTVARKCADVFALPFYFAAKVESEYMLLGFKDARGETVRTQFREAYENGGVFLFDELDGSSPSAVVAMNAALANGVCPFPDGTINKHPDFKCIAAGNTKLSGASREYVGRNQLDAASVDRFVFIEFGYDEQLERAIASNSDWCKYVQSARRAVAARQLKHLVTPRATLDGCTLLGTGIAWDEVETMVLWKGLDIDTVRQLQGAMDYTPEARTA